MELWRYIRTIKRRFWLVLIVWLPCIAGVAVLAKYQAKGFTATAAFKEEIRDYETGAPPRVQALPFDARLSNIATYVTSRTVVERSLEDIGVIRPNMSEDERAAQVSAWSSGRRLTAGPTAARNSMILITVRTEEPPETKGRLAKAFADAVLKNFEQYYRSIGTDSLREGIRILEEDLAKQGKVTRGYLDQIERLTTENQMTVSNAEYEASQTLNTLVRTQADYDQARLSVRQYESTIAVLQQKLNAQEVDRTSQTTTIPNPLHQRLLQQINEAQTRLNEQLTLRTEKYPEIVAAKETLKTLQEQLADTPERIPSVEVHSPNPMADDLLSQLNRSIAMRDGQAAVANGMARILETIKAKADRMPGVSSRMSNLRSEYEVASRNYQVIAGQLNDAQMKLTDARIRSSIFVVEPVSVSPRQSNAFLYIALAVVLGFVLACGVAFMASYMDNTVRTPEQAESLLQLPIYATLPKVRSPRLEIADPMSATVAALEMLSTNLWLSDPEVERPTFLIASALPDVGRSTVAANLAVTLARDGARVILVDADFRDPCQHTAFEVANDSGLSNVLAGDQKIEDVLVKTSQENLLLITSGPPPQNPIRLLRGKTVDDFVEKITGYADFVIFDSPAGVTFADASLLAASVRNVIIVHQAGRAPRGAEDEFRRRLERVDARLVGAVLNRVRREDSHGYYHFYRAYKGLMGPEKHEDVRALPKSGGSKD